MSIIITFYTFLYYFGYLLTIYATLASGEYLVKNVVPSYLYRKIDNVKEDIFPEDVRIKVSLSKMEGTLLYTIDKNMNQMIVSLHDGLSLTLGIEFRSKGTSINIYKLCLCEICRYEVLDIKIEIKDKINVQCNTGRVRSYPYDNIKEINKVYYMPKNIPSMDTSSPNEGYLWLVNTPGDKDIYPNPLQLSGCIFSVWYKNKPIIFGESVNITNQCPKFCKKNSCNGGQCYERYGRVPLCDCTKTFLNGKFCNQTSTNLNIQSVNESFQFPMFKLSWNSSSNEILRMNNNQFQISLRTINGMLLFEYNNGKKNIDVTNILSREYKKNKEYILIVIFRDSLIDIQFFNGSWFWLSLSSVINLGGERITSITLQSGDGQISLAYKENFKSLKWRILKIKNQIKINNQNGNESDIKRTISMHEKIPNNLTVFFVTLLVMIIFEIILSGLSILLSILNTRKSKINQTQKSTLNESLEKSAKDQANNFSLLKDAIKNLSHSSINSVRQISNKLQAMEESLEKSAKDQAKKNSRIKYEIKNISEKQEGMEILLKKYGIILIKISQYMEELSMKHGEMEDEKCIFAAEDTGKELLIEHDGKTETEENNNLNQNMNPNEGVSKDSIKTPVTESEMKQNVMEEVLDSKKNEEDY